MEPSQLLLDKAKTILNSKEYAQAMVDFFQLRKQGAWIAACTECDWLGCSVVDMVVKKHGKSYKTYYTHHCPKCDAVAFNPKEAIEDHSYQYNTPPAK